MTTHDVQGGRAQTGSSAVGKELKKHIACYKRNEQTPTAVTCMHRNNLDFSKSVCRVPPDTVEAQ